jgi:SRSO17 transposase
LYARRFEPSKEGKVDLHDASEPDARFRAYAADLASVLGHVDRVKPFEDYCTGLISAEGRKSVEPLAAVTAPERTAAQHQSLLHLVAQAPWSDAAVLRRVLERVLPSVCREEPIQAWIIDDTGYPKKGKHSVGVARQYCGQVGKQDNCQVAVSLSVATHQGSLPVAYRLYLPKDWADDPVRRAKVGVPDDVTFQTKPEIALQQMHQARADGVPPAVALADPAYGNDGKFRAGIAKLGLPYAVGIMPSTTVWRPGEAPLPPARKSGRGRRATRLRRDKTHQPVSIKALALELPADAWQQIAWREGSNTVLASRFARLRVRVAHGDARRREPAAEEWLLIEWPDGEAAPDHYWLSTLPADITFEHLVDLAKLRWRIERDYLELKQEVGLDHYEGRGWRGFHHHASLCIAAYGFLISETETIPPSGSARAWRRPRSAVPAGYRPRGVAAALPAPCAELNRYTAHPPRTHLGGRIATMPVLRAHAAALGQAD